MFKPTKFDSMEVICEHKYIKNFRMSVIKLLVSDNAYWVVLDNPTSCADWCFNTIKDAQEKYLEEIEKSFRERF